jgi:hypothetical protein
MPETPATAAAYDRLSLRQFAEHIERMERLAGGPTYPVWLRPFRRWHVRLVDDYGVICERFGTALTRREAQRRAVQWNSRPLRDGYRIEVCRGN